MGFQRGCLRSISIIGTLNGVVCLCDWERDLHIWNPRICKSFTLALPDGFQCDIVDESWDCYGFWIDPSTKAFKIIILLFRTHPKEDVYVREGYLYSSKRHDWSVIPRGELGEWESSTESTAVMLGGVGHWVGDDHNHKVKVILSFDFEQERFEFIEMNGVKYGRKCVPCHWQGKLSVLCLDEVFPHKCDLYSRQEGNSWAHMFGFDLCAPTPIVSVFWPLEGRGRDVLEGHGSVVAAMRHEDRVPEDELVLYDAKFGCIPLKSGLINCFLVNMAYDFVESLLFP